uniref:BZIP domain-containing protein n=1 Tax=Nelumbo nucifera TaxID=4432 RepID=A0A822ZML6_NELNU|nr:TPA_asm: hypothetical protein HUJ06_016399 [Nelumbo nucifera]
MNDGEVQPDDGLLDQIDWVSFFDSIPDNLNQLAESPLGDSVSIQEPPSALQISASTWINDIEQLLMADDDEESREEDRRGQCEEFFADIDFLVDGSADGSYEERVFKEGGSTPESNVSDDGREKEKSVGSEVKNGRDEADDDPISKKRRRQLRNRDAAVRSRERKKIYVRDLEMKSRYLEGECRRLERLLQCCIAENQTLHLYLQKDKGLGAPMTKLESAVLLLGKKPLHLKLWALCLSLHQCSFQVPSIKSKNTNSGMIKLVGCCMRVLVHVMWLFFLWRKFGNSHSLMGEWMSCPFAIPNG